MEEKKVGEVIKYFGKIGVAAIRLSEGSLKVGDTIHMVGHTTTHEVGHALGIFTHAPGAEELMNADPEVAGPSELDRATIERMSHAQRTLRPVRSP